LPRSKGGRTTAAPVHVLGWYRDGRVEYGIPVPRLLSLLAFHSTGATVQGLDAVAPADRPPVNVVRLAFQSMVGIGSLLALLSVVFLFVRMRRGRLPESTWFYRALVAAGPLSVVALIAGWVVTEVGRQPWVVSRVMRTSQAVTGASGIPVGYATLAAVYLALAVGVAWVLRRLQQARLDTRASSRQTATDPH
jgi:cytochrome d ubiquinol oxidase subunit I